jgi:hypothetical protein
MQPYEIWAEGYRCAGSESGAVRLATITAASFAEAVWAWVAQDPSRTMGCREDESGKVRYWGCTLFDNEHDARATFG